MPDSNPTLTAALMGERTHLMGERNDILKKISELSSMLEMNSTQIEATDTLMLRFNPEHVSIDVRTALEGSPLITVARMPLQISSSASKEAVEQTPHVVAASSEPEPKVAEPLETMTGTKQPAMEKSTTGKVAVKGSKPLKQSGKEETPAVAGEPERNPDMQAISRYFQNSNRSETILQILRAMEGPVSAKTIAGHYRALFPLPNDSTKMRSLHNSRIAAALYYLKDRGQAERSVEGKGDGKRGENVFWSLSKSYRNELKKASAASRREKVNGHSSVPPQASTELPQMSGTTH